MQGEGTSRIYSFPKTSGKKAMGMRGDLDNVIIDVDIDIDDNNVIIIDVPETFQPEPKRSPIKNIIHIDDDESHYADHSEISGEDDAAFDSDYTPRTSPASNCMRQSKYVGANDCGGFQEKAPAFKLSKCKNLYTNKSPPTNRYGLSSESESDSGSDSSDCEVIEGSSSELREQWEKVCLKKKSNSYDKFSGLQDQVSPCNSQTDTQPNAKMGNRTKQNLEDPGCSRGNKSDFQDGCYYDFLACEDGDVGISFDPWIDVDYAEANDFSRLSKPKSRNSSASQWKSDVSTSEQTCSGNCDFQFATRLNERFDSCGHSPRSIHRTNKKVSGTSSFPHNKQRTVGEESSKCPVAKPNLDSGKRCSVQDHDEEASLCKDQVSRVMHSLNAARIFSAEIDSGFSEATSIRNISSDERTCGILGSKVKDKLCSKTHAAGHSSLSKLISNDHDGNNSLDALSGDVILTQNDIINEKDRLKETDEYKRAVEEEWAARQQQLIIQAEEAKRLKKRRKAETLRILDMQKRQKQRVEEVRETQRKDEENLNMKEHLRAEIRRELHKLESTSTDMASLLRGLGIHVEGGFRPLVQEVNAAYKRALLKFHPDRASRSDIRQQVEAEEKFKLISRMKEKLFH